MDNCSAAKERDSSTVVTLSARKGARGGDVCIHRPAVFRSNKSSRRVPPSFYRGREVQVPLSFNPPPPQPVFLYIRTCPTIVLRSEYVSGGIFFTVSAPWNEILRVEFKIDFRLLFPSLGIFRSICGNGVIVINY